MKKKYVVLGNNADIIFMHMLPVCAEMGIIEVTTKMSVFLQKMKASNVVLPSINFKEDHHTRGDSGFKFPAFQIHV